MEKNSNHRQRTGLRNTDTDFHLKFAEHVHKYINDHIQFADKKSAFVFTLGAALLVFLYQRNLLVTWLKNPLTWDFLDTLAFISMVVLAASVLTSIFVVFPRRSGSQRGYVFWKSISQFDSADNYVKKVVTLNKSELIEELFSHCYELSKICKKKYQLLSFAIWFGVVGIVTTVIYLFLG